MKGGGMGYTQVNLADKSERIGTLQRMLCLIAARDRDPRMETYVTGCWNGSTEEALRAFQEREGLPVTGICGLESWDAAVRRCSEIMDETEPVCLRVDPAGICGPGDEGDGVLLLQIVLRAAAEGFGFDAPPADGCYGAATEGAVSAFQKAACLPRTGRADLATWRMLAAWTNSRRR